MPLAITDQKKKMSKRISLIIFLLTVVSVISYAQGLTDATLYSHLIGEGVKEPKIVLAQAKLETGNYKSNLCVQKNNLFGLKGGRGYMSFSSYKECIRYYKSHIQNKYDGHSNYYTFLQRIGYARDPRYVAKLKNIISNLNI